MNAETNLLEDLSLDQMKCYMEEFRVRENKKSWEHFAQQGNNAKVCPFCGKAPLVWSYGGSKNMVKCITDGCPMNVSNIYMFLEIWNSRPYEDILIDEIERLQLKLKEAGAL